LLWKIRRDGRLYARDGWNLTARLMAQWLGWIDFELESPARYVLHTIKESDNRPFGGSGPPMAAYRFKRLPRLLSSLKL
jgi:hypothetical protein